MPLKTVRFETYERFLNYLTKCRDNETLNVDETPTEAADHERAHIEKAEALGYTPVYAVRIFTSDGLTPVDIFVDFPNEEPTDSHLIEICLAPENPSEGDLEIVQKLRRES
jgi:hypothetical protein|tara:strand:+ start:8721 stop:9053 length:333 start_codon:yes stop_codon:yes gene_type:complete